MSAGNRNSKFPAQMLRSIALLGSLIVLTALSGCSEDGNSPNKVNGSVRIPAGREAASTHTVNGSIHIDDNAAVTTAGTVNGGVHLGAHATATSLSSVNGSISVGEGAHTTADVESVNGDLTLANGADVAGSIANVNGKISLTAAHVGGAIRTVSGNISVMGASRVDGGILVKKPSSEVFKNDDPIIVIGPGATVQGELRFERKVRLFVSDKATIGTVTGATPVPFSGDTPPSSP